MDSTDHGSPEVTRSTQRMLVALSAIPLVVQLIGLIPAGYSYFIDEFYYFACAARPAFGYVDHPPLAPWILALTRPVLGDSLLGLRLVPFLAGSATVWVTCLLVARLGGGRFATVLAGVSLGLAPLFLGMSGFFSMNAFEPLFWMLIVLTVTRIVQTGGSRLWAVVGLLVGLSFENKHTAMVYVVALGIGLLATRTRRILLDRWLWAGAAIALLLALPNVLWQVANGFPSLEFYRNAHFLKNVPSPPLRSFATLFFAMNPLTLPIWVAGFVFLIAYRDGRVFRFLGVTCLLLLVAHVASQTSRPDRVAGMFPILLAAGAVVLERMIHARSAQVALVGATVVAGLPMAPFVVPLLTPPVLAKYAAVMGLTYSVERGKTSPIPQLLADRTGWESYIDDVERAYRNLSPEDRQRAIIYAPSYGQAGAAAVLVPLPRRAGRRRKRAVSRKVHRRDDRRAHDRAAVLPGSCPCETPAAWARDVAAPLAVLPGSAADVRGCGDNLVVGDATDPVPGGRAGNLPLRHHAAALPDGTADADHHLRLRGRRGARRRCLQGGAPAPDPRSATRGPPCPGAAAKPAAAAPAAFSLQYPQYDFVDDVPGPCGSRRDDPAVGRSAASVAAHRAERRSAPHRRARRARSLCRHHAGPVRAAAGGHDYHRRGRARSCGAHSRSAS